MVEYLQLWTFGTAALIDTVLLFALLERHNWRSVTIWMLLLAVGAWSWHAGFFVLQLLTASVGSLANPMRWVAMLSMALGLMLMPSAALHGALQLLRLGRFQQAPSADPRLALCYAPLLWLVPIGRALLADPTVSFVGLLSNFRMGYGVWLGIVSLFTAYGLCSAAWRLNDRPLRRFYYLLAGSMCVIASLTAIYIVCLDYLPEVAWSIQSLVALLPILPSMLFAYFVMRFQLLPFVLERTLVYGAVLTGAVLFHQVIVRRLITTVEQQYRLDLGVIEGIGVFLTILLYQPYRKRVAEALQSLLESSASRRHERQRLAVQLATRSGDPAPELLGWFTETIQQSFGTEFVAAWLCDREGHVLEQAGATHVLEPEYVSSVMQTVADLESHFVTRLTVTHPLLLPLFDRGRAGALLWFEHVEVRGLFLIGCQRWSQTPTDEDLHALSLLVEQFGVTVHNSRLLAIQVAAEQRFLQQEKLSTLGLVASSLAHEIKNPLSAIKTITRVLAEDLGTGSQYAEDLRMISGEIDRLTISTSELLSVVRPPRADLPHTPLGEALAPTLRLLTRLGQECDVTVQTQFPVEPIFLTMDHVGLREIVFNLVTNAIQAVGGQGTVQFQTSRHGQTLMLKVQDTGCGLTTDQQQHLFEPFYSTKSTGTGLGLYIVSRRVRELGGQIHCQSVLGQGTEFTVILPLLS